MTKALDGAKCRLAPELVLFRRILQPSRPWIVLASSFLSGDQCSPDPESVPSSSRIPGIPHHDHVPAISLQERECTCAMRDSSPSGDIDHC